MNKPMNRPEFTPFPKIARLRRGCVITEKIDGTNAQIVITADGDVFAGSRNRWITPEDDNFGFARWVEGNKTSLLALGEGQHFGEWWGCGIQRGYGVQDKRFSLFNSSRWAKGAPEPCLAVPVLYAGEFDSAAIASVLLDLGAGGSKAAPGWMDPEGIVIYHPASRGLFKVTIKGDDEPKSRANQ